MSSNPYRGLSYDQHVLPFSEIWQPGDVIWDREGQYDWSDWCESRGLPVKRPNGPGPIIKSSPEWIGYLHQRRDVRYKFNLAASHPRVLEYGLKPFEVISVGTNALQVMSVPVSSWLEDVHEALERLARARRKHGRHLQEAIEAQLQRYPDSVPDAAYMAIKLHQREQRAMIARTEWETKRIIDNQMALEQDLIEMGVRITDRR